MSFIHEKKNNRKNFKNVLIKGHRAEEMSSFHVSKQLRIFCGTQPEDEEKKYAQLKTDLF